MVLGLHKLEHIVPTSVATVTHKVWNAVMKQHLKKQRFGRFCSNFFEFIKHFMYLLQS